MSNIGLYGSIYEQLRAYADKLDKALVGLRNVETASKARQDIAALLQEITSKDTPNPAGRFVSLTLKRELPARSGQGLGHYEELARQLTQRIPTSLEIEELEQLALALDKECSTTLERIKGKS